MNDDLQRAIGSVEAKVDILLERTRGFDTRLSAVEKKVWWASGGAAMLAFFLAHFTKGTSL